MRAPRVAALSQVADLAPGEIPGIFVSVRVLEWSKEGGAAKPEKNFSVLGGAAEQKSGQCQSAEDPQVEVLAGDLRGSRTVKAHSAASEGGTVVEVEGFFVPGRRLLSLVPPFMARPVSKKTPAHFRSPTLGRREPRS